MPSREWFVERPDVHTLAPDFTRAIYRALRWEEPDANGCRSTRVLHEPPRFDGEPNEGFGGNFLSVVIDEEHTVRKVRHPPTSPSPAPSLDASGSAGIEREDLAAIAAVTEVESDAEADQ